MDIQVLAALRDKQKYKQLRDAVPDGMLGPDTVAMLKWFSVYFEAFPEHTRVDTDTLRSLFAVRAGGCSDEQRAVMTGLFDMLDEPVPQGAITGLTRQLYTADMVGRASALLNAYLSGDEVDVVAEIATLIRDTQKRQGVTEKTSCIDMPITELLAEQEHDSGLKLPTTVLREHVAALRGGDVLGVAGRVDTGKTSLIAFILTHFATQLKDIGCDGRPMLWLNNEGSGKRIVPRVYQAALGVNFDELTQLARDGVLQDRYDKAMHGQRVVVHDVHGAGMSDIEQLIIDLDPCVVVYDMMANVKVRAAANANKTDGIEGLWQEGRELAVRYDHVAIPTVQISVEGANMLYPPLHALKDSKTGAQGAMDVLLCMGALDAPEMRQVRGFSTPKNKRQMTGKPGYLQAEVFFDPQICRFTDGLTT